MSEVEILVTQNEAGGNLNVTFIQLLIKNPSHIDIKCLNNLSNQKFPIHSIPVIPR